MPHVLPSNVIFEAVTSMSIKVSLLACDYVRFVRRHQSFERICCLFFTLQETIFHPEDGTRIYLRNRGTCVPNYIL
jgi:hypothetical protein